MMTMLNSESEIASQQQATSRVKHHMVTRSKSGIFKPKIFNTTLDTTEPSTHEQAMQKKNWTAAMMEEYEALMKNKTQDLVHIPKDKNIIGCKWTYKLKRNADGTISTYKARLVAKGYSQQSGFDFS